MARGKVAKRYSPTRDSQKNEGDTNRWLGTYGDAVTLLLAFFVILYSMSQMDQLKFEAFVQGLQIPFGNAAASDTILDGLPAVVSDGDIEPPTPPLPTVVPLEPPPVKPESATPPIEDPPTPTPPSPAPPSPESEADSTAENVPVTLDLAQLAEVRAAVDASLTGEGLVEFVDSRIIEERGLVFSIGSDDVLFDTGSTVINDLGRRIIAAVSQPLRSYPNDVLVEGHTDNVPLNRHGYTNWNLSTDRAVAVLSMLVDDFALQPTRLGAVGFGEFRPRVPNDSGANRSMNRRVDILVVAEGETLHD